MKKNAYLGENEMKKLLSLLLVLVVVFTLVACSAKTSFTVVTTDLDGKETTHKIKTGAATVGEALIEEGLIKGHTTDHGLYVDEVNGIALDRDKDGKYWACYINGAYAQTGVDTTNVEDGAVYTFKPEYRERGTANEQLHQSGRQRRSAGIHHYSGKGTGC